MIHALKIKISQFVARKKSQKINQAYAFKLYDKLIHRARNKALYQVAGGLPDNYETRTECLFLHLFLFYQRCHNDPILTPIADQMANIVTKDMEDNLRELGAGDMKIGKKVKAMMLRLYGRLDAYWGAFSSSQGQEKAQINCLQRNLFSFGGGEEPQIIETYRHYIAQFQAALKQQASDEFLNDDYEFPHITPSA